MSTPPASNPATLNLAESAPARSNLATSNLAESDLAESDLAAANPVIITLTPRCVTELSNDPEYGQSAFIAIAIDPNDASFRYRLEFREPTPSEQAILTSSKGISLALNRDDAEFLRGTTLDYLPNAGVFKLSNSREDISLRTEYCPRLIKNKTKKQPLRKELMARAKRIDPQRAVADLQTSGRQDAFRDLQLWWRLNQPDAADIATPHETICQVDRYQQSNGEWITVVFTKVLDSDPGGQTGGIYLINSNGLLTPIFHGNNYLDGDDRFVDVNADGLPEVVCAIQLGGVVTHATGIEIIPITSPQTPLLRMVCDVRRNLAEPTWSWKLMDNLIGTKDVVLGQQTGGNWTERAKFVWSAEKLKFEGPTGSRSEGYIAIANTGEFAPELFEDFMAPR